MVLLNSTMGVPLHCWGSMIVNTQKGVIVTPYFYCTKFMPGYLGLLLEGIEIINGMVTCCQSISALLAQLLSFSTATFKY